VLRGPRRLFVERVIRKVEWRLSDPRAHSGKINWTPSRTALANDYLILVRDALANNRVPDGPYAWGREGILESWGHSPKDSDPTGEELVELENAVSSLVSASDDIEVLRGLGALFLKLVDGKHMDKGAAPVSKDLVSIADLLENGEYLEKPRIQQWRQAAIELGGSIPQSSYDLVAPSSPAQPTNVVRPDSEYWKNRNVLHMTGQEQEYFDNHDGRFWTLMFIANFRLCERFGKDEMWIDSWRRFQDAPS
jgi:hypothetical protein